MTIIGNNIIIEFDSVDYTTSFSTISEAGGDKEYSMIKAMGNNYKKVLTGQSAYELTFEFKVEDTTLLDFFADDSERIITITMTDSSGGTVTITYNNMITTNLNIIYEAEDLTMGELTYTAKPIVNDTDTRVIS